jgi:hypothetical protein
MTQWVQPGMTDVDVGGVNLATVRHLLDEVERRSYTQP